MPPLMSSGGAEQLSRGVIVNINPYTGIVLAVVMVMRVQSLDRPRAQCGSVVYWIP